MFIVYKSNNLNCLLSKSSQIIQEKPLDNIFSKEIFIYDNQVLFQYLNIFLAQKTGISSNFQLYHPNDFVWKLFEKLLHKKKKITNLFTSSIIMWKIIKILDNKNFIIPFNIKQHTIEKFKFAFLMARIYKKYIFYRPNWIHEFEKEKNISLFNNEEQWQAKLWGKIVQDIKENNNSTYNFSNLFISFKLLLQEKKIKKISFPSRLFIISSFSLNPSYIDIFKKISAYTNVYFLYITPYKYNIFNTNINTKSILKKYTYKKNIIYDSLIKLWGKYAKIYEFLLLESKTIKIINCFQQYQNNTLLNNIKNDFLNKNQLFSNKKKRLLKSHDHSISINICYNKKNEIEILYKKLLLFLQENPSITPGDIIITSTSIETYIPYINLIFNTIDQKKIPFFISHNFNKKIKTIILAFEKILDLSNSRFENQEILEFLNIPEIANKFDISDEEIKILYHWVEETNIRWAFDCKHKHDLCFPRHKENTWLYGIEKLLISYSMNNKENIWNNILACSLINGSRVELISKLIIFIKQLKKWKNKLSKLKNIKYWHKLSHDIIDDFFSYTEETENIFQIIQKNWEKIISDCIISYYTNKISINVLKKIFLKTFDVMKKKNILPGVINFCHPRLVFAIPFKIVCIIGADHNSLPEENQLDHFNLLKKYFLLGDDNVYEKHCYLFFQSISCAEKYFYISYIGYSLKNQSKVYPSILIDQLINYIALNFYLIHDENLDLYNNKKNIIQHLCKEYHKLYFYKKTIINKNVTNTVQYTYKYINQQKNNKYTYDNQDSDHKIHLKDLINFWTHPIRYFFNFHLNIKVNQNKNIIQTTEPFSVNQIDAFKIKNILLSKIIHNQNTDQIFQYYLASGKLPYGTFGRIFWDKTIQDMKSIAELVIQFRINTQEKKINLNIEKYKITGLLSEIQDTGLLRWKPNIINYHDRISLWLEHLLYSILGYCGESKIIGYKKQIWSFSSLNPNLAYFYLCKYIKGYIQGIKKPILLTKSGASWLDQVYDFKNNLINHDTNIQKKGKQKLLETWIGSIFSNGEENDFYIRKIFIELNECNIQKICLAAQKWLIPILQHKKK